jgi:hypothetical protein
MVMDHRAVYALYPNVVRIVHDIPYDINGNIVELDMAAVNAWVDPNAYKERRVNKYPPIGDQLDDLFHSGAFSPEMAAKIQAVKDKYPKGN